MTMLVSSPETEGDVADGVRPFPFALLPEGAVVVFETVNEGLLADPGPILVPVELGFGD